MSALAILYAVNVMLEPDDCLVLFSDTVRSPESPISFQIHVRPDEVEGKEDINTGGGVCTTVSCIRILSETRLFTFLAHCISPSSHIVFLFAEYLILTFTLPETYPDVVPEIEVREGY